MISARRAALLGIGFPLSPIMMAVLGLLPDEEDIPQPPLIVFGGGGGGGGVLVFGRPKAAKTPATKPKPATEDENEPQIRRQNDLVLALAMALVTEELA